MPPKKAPDMSKKTVQKKKQQVIEDKTFGLKNKNKSKKVQQHINSVEKNVMNSGDPKQRRLEELRKQQKVEAKARKKAMEDERNALFGEALLAVQKKSTNTNQKEGKTEAVGRDGNDDAGNKKNTSRAMKMMFQMDAAEMDEKLREDPNYIPTVEDEIEAERQRLFTQLAASGKKGTPITPETFATWQEHKRKKRQEEAKRLVEIELRKKKGGKGLSVLSGRALYEYKKELFDKVDDDDNYQYDDLEEDKDDDDGGRIAVANGNNNGKMLLRGNGSSITTPALSQQYSAIDFDADGDNHRHDDDDDRASGVTGNDDGVEKVVAHVQRELFLQGDDDDLDDLDDDDDGDDE